MTPTGKVNLIGAGPGDVELMTLRALRMLKEADAVVYDRLVSPEILDLSPEGARMIAVGKAPKCHTVPQDRINEILAELALQGLTVARLKGGDPMIFGRGSEEAAYLMDRGITVEYAPGITAAQGMASATGVPLTHRGLATGVRYVTGHRAADQSLDLDWASLADTDTTLVVYMGVANIPWFLAKTTTGLYAGSLLDRFIPAEGPQSPETLWWIYFAIAIISPIGLIAARKWLLARVRNDGVAQA